ncbi:MAG: hypothetical protein GX024_10385 [Clostridiales bacterium]|jgi:hypothetical protein|nr:hypothetical protein [Clostridiales bacterium]
MKEKIIADNTDDVLLDLIHIALLNWKKTNMSCRMKDKVVLGKGVYICLLKEAKKRGLFLNSKQLLDRILYPQI